jgi:glutamate racemase
LHPEKLRDAQQSLLETIKNNGADNDSAINGFLQILDCMESNTAILACTEFPLLLPHLPRDVQARVTFLDPTQLLAERLVALSCGFSSFSELAALSSTRA